MIVPDASELEAVMRYHERTKHHFNRFARGPSEPVNLRTLSRLLEYALALSAWKQAGGTRWALRVNPSSGNLHPTEGYVLIGGIAELGEAAHCLERVRGVALHPWAISWKSSLSHGG